MDNDTGFGWKMLGPYGATEYDGVETFYPLPREGEKFGPWFAHPDPALPDGRDCGPGRWHIMLTRGPDARYAPYQWWPWFAQWRGLIGRSDEKCGVREMRLRRVGKSVFWRIIRMGWCQGAYLQGANLRDADLKYAYLQGTDLQYAKLRDADLQGANLKYAKLNGTDLRYAKLNGTDLQYAYLQGTDLQGANLHGANLRDADLQYANYCKHTVWPSGFEPKEYTMNYRYD